MPHPVTGLTKLDIENVRRAWETIRSDRAAVVSTVFIKCVNHVLFFALFALGLD